jgi:hypothetical protein
MELATGAEATSIQRTLYCRLADLDEPWGVARYSDKEVDRPSGNLIDYALSRTSDADTPPADFCLQLLADRHLYQLPPTIPSARWQKVLRYIARTSPDYDEFEAELDEWQRWPPVRGSRYFSTPDLGFNIGHSLSLMWKCWNTTRYESWCNRPEPALRLVLRHARGMSRSDRLRRCQPAPTARPQT